MPAEVVEAIKRATLQVFAIMVGVNVVPQSPLQCSVRSKGVSIVSSFNLRGAVYGVAEVCYALTLAKRITREMLQIEELVTDTDVADVVGEVANMIIGNINSSLERRWGTIHLGTPAVALFSQRPEGNNSSTVTFCCDDEQLTVSLAFRG